MSLTPADLDEIRGRMAERCNCQLEIIETFDKFSQTRSMCQGRLKHCDLHAHAPADIAALLAEVTRLKKRICPNCQSDHSTWDPCPQTKELRRLRTLLARAREALEASLLEVRQDGGYDPHAWLTAKLERGINTALADLEGDAT